MVEYPVRKYLKKRVAELKSFFNKRIENIGQTLNLMEFKPFLLQHRSSKHIERDDDNSLFENPSDNLPISPFFNFQRTKLASESHSITNSEHISGAKTKGKRKSRTGSALQILSKIISPQDVDKILSRGKNQPATPIMDMCDIGIDRRPKEFLFNNITNNDGNSPIFNLFMWKTL